MSDYRSGYLQVNNLDLEIFFTTDNSILQMKS